MKRLIRENRDGKTSVVDREIDVPESWYFVRLAFLAIPWQSRRNKNAKGTLFKQYYLVKATGIKSAFNKANYILSVSEHREGDGVLDGKRVIFKSIGILDLEPLYEPIKSGAELFDESEGDVAYAGIKKQVISSHKRIRMIAHEKRKGKPSLLDVYWGEDFDRL